MLRRVGPVCAPRLPQLVAAHLPPANILPARLAPRAPHQCLAFQQHLKSVALAPLLVSGLEAAPSRAPVIPPAASLPVPGSDMEECAVPKKKRSARRNRIRRSSKFPKPVSHIGRCNDCGKLKLMHVACSNCGGMRMAKLVLQKV